MKTSLWKKIKFYFEYKKIIKFNLARLQGQFNLRKDRVNRLYTVLNLPEDAAIYGNDLSEKYIKKYLADFDSFNKQSGLSQLIGILNIEKIDALNYLIIFGYSGFDTAKIANRIIISIIILVLTTTVFGLIF